MILKFVFVLEIEKKVKGENELEQHPQKSHLKDLIESLEIEEKSVISYSFLKEEDEKKSK
ncbi:MAG: hypothetical protein JW891_00500 [Candidatus Lokiarchaeota archaeon]|nr:hypothetical protein [Candidatus Lokiarchaeota archaeon]